MKVIVGVGVRVMVRERVKVRIRVRARGEEGTCGALEERSEAGAAAGRERSEPRVVSESVHGGEAGAVLEGQLQEAVPLLQHQIRPTRPAVAW